MSYQVMRTKDGYCVFIQNGSEFSEIWFKSRGLLINFLKTLETNYDITNIS